jgi:hypothetical protein
MISLSSLVTVVIYLLVVGCIFWLLQYLINYINPPEPFKKVLNVVLVVFAVLIIIGVLLSLVNGQQLFRV